MLLDIPREHRMNNRRLHASLLLLACWCTVSYAIFTFPDDGFGRQTSTCVKIPEQLKLCYGVGYDKMVLPNLLKHDNMKEVFHQSQSFVPLMSMKCHPLVRIFLCSLYAPVCLPDNSAVRGPIPPCKSLCQAVERGCAPVLAEFSFEWPAMLNCSQFANEDPCLSVNETSANEGSYLITDCSFLQAFMRE